MKSVVKEIWNQRRSTSTKGMKLLDDNARPHIHSDVINYLTEEGMNIMLIYLTVTSYDYWLNNYIKRNLIDHANEKRLTHVVSKVVKNIPEEEFLRNR